jgi:segregation and condensation protein B
MSDVDETEPEAEADAEAAPDAEAEAEVEAAAAAEEAEDAEADARMHAADLPDPQLKALIEAVIFAADKPVTLQRIRQLTRVTDMPRLARLVEELKVDRADSGVVLQEVSGGLQFRTHATYSQWVQQLVAGRPVRLSRAQLETLAIIAYRQPITRPEIDEIRGVDSSQTLRLLHDRSLIRILGKREEPGRPLLYGTTREFLDFFSLSDLRELPTLREFSELSAESQEAVRKLGMDEAAPDGDAPAGEPDPEPEPAGANDAIEVDSLENVGVPDVVAAEGSGPHPQSESWS